MSKVAKTSPKQEQILAGALPVFLKHGYERTSMDRVAEAAGVSKQTLYSYFKDKEGLFMAIAERMAQEKFRLVWSKPLEGEPKQVLRRLAEGICSEVEHEEYLYFMRLVMAESGKRPELGQLMIKNLAKPAIKILADYLQQQQQLKLKDPEAVAWIFVGTIIYYILNQEALHGKPIMPMKGDRLIDQLIDLIIV